MIKNNYFSFERFSLLLKKDFMESWKTILLRFVTLYAVLAVVFCFLCYKNCQFEMILAGVENNVRYLGFTLFLFFGFGCIFASSMMEKMQSKTKRISYLMTPATSFEKYFSGFVQVVVIFIIAFFVAFKLADFTRVAIFSICYPSLDFIPIDLKYLVPKNGELFNSWQALLVGFSIYLFYQSLFVLGSTLWYKKPFIKTIAAGVAIYLIFITINGTLIHFLFPNNLFGFFDAIRYCDITFDKISALRNITILFSCLTLFNWIMAYFRFKESEIINRI